MTEPNNFRDNFYQFPTQHTQMSPNSVPPNLPYQNSPLLEALYPDYYTDPTQVRIFGRDENLVRNNNLIMMNPVQQIDPLMDEQTFKQWQYLKNGNSYIQSSSLPDNKFRYHTVPTNVPILPTMPSIPSNLLPSIPQSNMSPTNVSQLNIPQAQSVPIGVTPAVPQMANTYRPMYQYQPVTPLIPQPPMSYQPPIYPPQYHKIPLSDMQRVYTNENGQFYTLESQSELPKEEIDFNELFNDDPLIEPNLDTEMMSIVNLELSQLATPFSPATEFENDTTKQVKSKKPKNLKKMKSMQQISKVQKKPAVHKSKSVLNLKSPNHSDTTEGESNEQETTPKNQTIYSFVIETGVKMLKRASRSTVSTPSTTLTKRHVGRRKNSSTATTPWNAMTPWSSTPRTDDENKWFIMTPPN